MVVSEVRECDCTPNEDEVNCPRLVQ